MLAGDEAVGGRGTEAGARRRITANDGCGRCMRDVQDDYHRQVKLAPARHFFSN